MDQTVAVRSRPEGTPVGRWGPGVVVGAAILVVAAALGRDLWFFSDDWNILADYHDGGLLEPFNGHLSLVPAGIYQLLFHTLGLDSYVPYRLVGLLALALLVAQVVRFAGARFASGRIATALAVAAILGNSAGQMNLLFPFLMNFSIPIAALVAIWWHLERADLAEGSPASSSRLRHELVASAWLVVALGSSGLGLMALAAVGVQLLVDRAPVRRWLVLVPGPALWALWYATHRDAEGLSSDPGAVLGYTARMIEAAFTSLGAGSRLVGWLLALLLVGYLALAAVRWRSLDGRTIGALVAPLAFALSTALTRVDNVPAIAPDELRYSWAISAYLVLVVLVAARPTPLLPDLAGRGPVLAATAVASFVLAAGGIVLVGDLREWNQRVGDARPGLSTVLYATQAVGVERADPDVVLPLSYVPVTSGGYLGAVASVGSPIAQVGPEGIGGAELDRQFADRFLVEQLPIGLRPAAATDVPTCQRPVARSDDGTLEVPPGSSLLLQGTGAVEVARFARDLRIPLGEVVDEALLVVPGDAEAAPRDEVAAEWPYRLSVPDGFEALACD